MSEPLILLDDELLPAASAALPLTSPGFAYAACVFEGICVYKGEDGTPLVFRLEDHLLRLEKSMRAMGFGMPPSRELLRARIFRALAENQIVDDAHIRVMVFIDGETRIDETGPSRTAILTRHATERPSHRAGFHCRVSSWRRPSDSALPARIKCTANYAIGRMATLEARRSGAEAPILLSDEGAVAEGATANFFLIQGDDLVTPRVTDGILEGITRDTLLRLWPEISGRSVIERRIDRSELINCDGAFFCGSLWEISLILSIDGAAVPFHDARVQALKHLYQKVVRGHGAQPGWCAPAWG